MANLLTSLKSPVGYIAVSLVLLSLYIIDCATTYREFYPIAIYLTNSATFKVLSVNAVVATIVAAYMFTEWLFFGKLNLEESTTRATAASLYVSDCVIGVLYSEQPLLGQYSAVLVLTTGWQVLHSVERRRVTSIGALPVEDPRHVRRRRVLSLVLFALFSTVVNMTVIVTVAHGIGDAPRKSMLARYVIMTNYTQTLFSTLHVLSLLVFGAWRSTELSHSAFLIRTFWEYAGAVHFVFSFAYVCAKVDPPFMLVRHLLREVLTFVETSAKLNRYLRLRAVTRTLPSATAEDLEADAHCTICFEDMLPDGTTKRLACGHCYHTECLQQWFQTNSTCPYCRDDQLKPKPRPPPAAAAPPAPAATAPPPDEGAAPAADRALPRVRITGEPAIDAAIEDALTGGADEEFQMMAAYARYREQWARQTLQRAAEPPGEAPNDTPPLAAAPSAPSLGAAAHPSPPSPVAAAPQATRSAPSEGGETVPRAEVPGTAPAALSGQTKDAARAQAYAAYRRAIKKADRELQAALRAIDGDDGGDDSS